MARLTDCYYNYKLAARDNCKTSSCCNHSQAVNNNFVIGNLIGGGVNLLFSTLSQVDWSKVKPAKEVEEKPDTKVK